MLIIKNFMDIMPLSQRLEKYLIKHRLQKQFTKQEKLFKQNPLHPNLHTEIMEPKYLKFYSFRLTHKYRVIFIYTGNNRIEIIDINNHYQ